MKVLFVYKFLTVGGVETVLRARLDALPAHGIDGHAWFFHDLGGRSVFRGCEERIRVGSPAQLAAGLAGSSYDLVTTFDSPELFTDLALPAGLSVVVECHSPYVENLGYLGDLRSPPVVEIWVPTDFQRGVVAARCRVPLPIEVLPNPIRQAFLDPVRPFPAPPSRPVVAWVGRMDELKNWRGFLELGRELLARGFPGELWMAGKPVEPAVAGEIRRLASEQGILPRLRWFRELPHEHLPAWIDAVRDSGGVVVSTSRGDAFGMTVAEAMARQCAVAAPAMGPFPEFVTDGETGLLLTPDKPADAAKRLLELLADGPRRARLGANARALIGERYAPEGSAKALVARLRALAATPAGTPSA